LDCLPLFPSHQLGILETGRSISDPEAFWRAALSLHRSSAQTWHRCGCVRGGLRGVKRNRSLYLSTYRHVHTYCTGCNMDNVRVTAYWHTPGALASWRSARNPPRHVQRVTAPAHRAGRKARNVCNNNIDQSRVEDVCPPRPPVKLMQEMRMHRSHFAVSASSPWMAPP
jgi:hypothetical protein